MTNQSIEEKWNIQKESIEWEEIFQLVMADIEKRYRVSDSLSDVLSDSLSKHLPNAITTAVETKEKSVIEILERHASWKPTEGHGSEEELGFQKGLMAEAKLIKSEILSIINPSKE